MELALINNGMGRGDTFTEDKRERYLGCLRRGLRHGEASKAAGLSRQNIWAWISRHPEFKEEIARAEAAYCDEVEVCLLKAITTKLSIPGMIFWLTNRSPDRWQDRRATAKIEVNAGTQPDPLAAAKDDLLQRIKSLPEGAEW